MIAQGLDGRDRYPRLSRQGSSGRLSALERSGAERVDRDRSEQPLEGFDLTVPLGRQVVGTGIARPMERFTMTPQEDAAGLGGHRHGAGT